MKVERPYITCISGSQSNTFTRRGRPPAAAKRGDTPKTPTPAPALPRCHVSIPAFEVEREHQAEDGCEGHREQEQVVLTFFPAARSEDNSAAFAKKSACRSEDSGFVRCCFEAGGGYPIKAQKWTVVSRLVEDIP